MYCDANVTEVCYQGSYWYQANIGSDNDFCAEEATSHYLNKVCLVYLRINASLDLKELNMISMNLYTPSSD